MHAGVLLLVLLVGVSASAPGTEFGSFLSKRKNDLTLCNPVQLDPKDPSSYCSFQFLNKSLKKGSFCLSQPERLLPTQVYVGKVEMDCHKDKLESLSSSDLVHELISNIIPVVIGPSGNLYLTDHHHFGLALFESFLDFVNPHLHKVAYVCIQEDLHQLSETQFWTEMENQNFVMLRDEFGRNITVSQLPKSLNRLRDNPYRTLANWLRHSNGFVKCGEKHTHKLPQCQNATAPFFLECSWAEFLLANFPLTNYQEVPIVPPPIEDFIWVANLQSQATALLSILGQAIELARSPAAANMPGFNLSPDKFPPAAAIITNFGCVAKK
eukprot:TRINITY_DN1599_c0_g1_i1.p1 TRINITY_DN1599_c0_g1~~TRINITY_DN1599_c0_g1_i1.p1  ORF type:complete len:325 (-),score=43.78 TRINITY_DN1599_c0_g1_i1:68-1042(-)